MTPKRKQQIKEYLTEHDIITKAEADELFGCEPALTEAERLQWYEQALKFYQTSHFVSWHGCVMATKPDKANDADKDILLSKRASKV